MIKFIKNLFVKKSKVFDIKIKVDPNAVYGKPIPMVYGIVKAGGNIIWNYPDEEPLTQSEIDAIFEKHSLIWDLSAELPINNVLEKKKIKI